MNWPANRSGQPQRYMIRNINNRDCHGCGHKHYYITKGCIPVVYARETGIDMWGDPSLLTIPMGPDSVITFDGHEVVQVP